MDTVYSTKKYFQSLAGSDYYRSPSVSRQVGTDYTSYRDTVGRRSTLGPSYTHMSKYSYATDHSIGSHYGGYNGGWGLWRDTGNLSPAMSVTKKRSIKSFSIILMTAAFIVVLAVLSVAGLAFYFSTFRGDMDNSALAFDGQFHVLRGDVFTTGLKYNHTSAFRQKRSYYEKLIETALQDRGGMSVTRCEIDSFGGGPLIHVKFRVLLDMKSMPMTMTNVEEHIKQSLLQEVTSAGSPFKNIKIDPETMDVKRLLDHEMLKSASFMREIDHQQQQSEETAAAGVPMTTRSTAYDEKVSKKSGVIEKTIHKFSATTSSMGSRSPSPTAPTGSSTPRPVTPSVIKGSYEITKTEADISEKKDTPPSQFHTTSTVPHGNHHHHHNKAPPPTTMKVKNGGGKLGTVPNGNATRPNLAKIDKIEKMNSTISSSSPAIPAISTSLSTPAATATTEANTPSSVSTPTMSSFATTTTTATVSPSSIISTSLPKQDRESDELDTTVPKLKNDNVHKYANNENLPQLDVNLFTSAPILDSQPWHPISPNADQRKPDQRKGHPATALANNDAERPHSPTQPAAPAGNGAVGATGDEEAIQQHQNKLMDAVTKAPTRPIYYQSFTNPTFSLTTLGIERLGAADVRPYPLPVNKLYNDELIGTNPGYDDDDEGVASAGMHLNEGEVIMNNPQVHLDGYKDRFEHLGGGVSAKKPDLSMDRVEEYLADGVTEPLEPKDTADGIILDTAADQPEQPRPADRETAPTKAPTSSTPTRPANDEQNEELGDILFDLLELDQEERHKFVPGIEAVTALPEEKFEETTKLNFINIREHILNKSKVGQEPQQPGPEEASTEQLLASQSLSKLDGPQQQSVTMMTPTTTTTTVRQPSVAGTGEGGDQTASANAKPNWEGPSLFPMHTTWELVNGTVKDQKQDQSHLRRVYNDTLQAWIVENSEEDALAATGNNDSTDMDISSSKKQEGTIQNISVIFDTLASKLGITPDVSSKSPPFQNKVRNRTTPPPPTVGSAVKTKIVATPPAAASKSTTIAPLTTTRTPTTRRTTFRSTNAPVTEPEIITVAIQEPEYDDEEYEDDAEEEVIRTTTTTTTTKRPRRKTTTKRRPASVTTSKPRTVSPGQADGNDVRPQSIRVSATSRPAAAAVTTSTPRSKSTTVPSKFRSTIVSSPADASRQRTMAPTTMATVTESVIPAIFQLDPTSDDVVPIIISDPDAPAGGETYEMSSEAVSFGKAEVEVVDPTVYEDLLRKQTTAMPPLVTLLPVRSNSGIRTFRTPMFRSGEIETRRAFAKLPAVPPPARVVTASMSVGA